MKAISLWEPWATAMSIGLKTNETRGRPTHVRGVIAIHAAMSTQGREFLTPAMQGAFRSKGRDPWKMNFGCIVATADLVDCIPTEVALIRGISATERMFGDYSPRRFAWIFKNIVALSAPIPAKGSQGFWNWNPTT